MTRRFTQREARALEEEIGAQLDWLEVTQYGDDGPMLLCISPVCDCCGRVAPAAQCGSCGAGPSWNGGRP